MGETRLPLSTCTPGMRLRAHEARAPLPACLPPLARAKVAVVCGRGGVVPPGEGRAPPAFSRLALRTTWGRRTDGRAPAGRGLVGERLWAVWRAVKRHPPTTTSTYYAWAEAGRLTFTLRVVCRAGGDHRRWLKGVAEDGIWRRRAVHVKQAGGGVADREGSPLPLTTPPLLSP